MKRDFLREPEYWNWLARLEMIHSKNIGDDWNSGALSVAKSISGMIFMSKWNSDIWLVFISLVLT
jgi:hypothetical protein